MRFLHQHQILYSQKSESHALRTKGEDSLLLRFSLFFSRVNHNGHGAIID